jgi:hypothetical protein
MNWILITKDSVIEYDQNKALKMPTLSILKLSNYADYGQITNSDPNWLLWKWLWLMQNSCIAYRKT